MADLENGPHSSDVEDAELLRDAREELERCRQDEDMAPDHPGRIPEDDGEQDQLDYPHNQPLQP